MIGKMIRKEDIENFLSFLLQRNSDPSSGSGPKVCRAVIKKLGEYDAASFKGGTESYIFLGVGFVSIYTAIYSVRVCNYPFFIMSPLT